MKTLTTCLGRLNNKVIDEKFNHYASDTLTRKEVHSQFKAVWSVDNHYKIAKELCVLTRNLKTEQSVLEQLSIDQQVVMLRCICEGSVEIKLGKTSELLVPGKVYVSYHPRAIDCTEYNIGSTQTACVLLSAHFYTQLLAQESWISNNAFYKNVTQQIPLPHGKKGIPLGFHFHQLVEEVLGCNWPNCGQMELVELKLKELFLQLHYQERFGAAQPGTNCPIIDEKITYASAYLKDHYNEPPTIKALSRVVLLNENTLKKEFKKRYGKPIRRYIIELRMKKARQLLQTHQVNDVASLLGYKSVPHFINTFKKYYGQTPKQFYSTT